MFEFKVTDTEGKVELLKKSRGIDLHEVKKILERGDWIDVKKHKKKPNQSLYVIRINDYCYLVPVVSPDNVIKTVWPSREATELYLKAKDK